MHVRTFIGSWYREFLRRENLARSIEALVHVLFWVFIFAAINVEWGSDWFDKSLRPNTPPPLTVLVFPFICYANAMWLIPNYFNREHWRQYLLFAFAVFILPELIRSLVMSSLDQDIHFANEFNCRDSFIWGAPSALFLALYLSFGYRFVKDLFMGQGRVEKRKSDQHTRPAADEKESSISTNDAALLQGSLETVMSSMRPYLDPELTLRDLASLIGTTDKKLSAFLNQDLNTNFYEYINTQRVNAFTQRVESWADRDFSIVGLAADCGFKSKSSFYRTFRKHMGISPSEYIRGRNS